MRLDYTLKDFLSGNTVPGILRLTEAADFSNVKIRSVSVQELPVECFIRADELVLSTAIGCMDEPERLLSLIRGVANARAAALLLAFENAAYRPPDEAIALANALHLSVFLIPWEHRFAQIQTAVAERIAAQKTLEYQRIQNTLINLYFESKSLSEAVERIAAFVGACVCVADHEGRTLAESGVTPAQKEPGQTQSIDIRIAGLAVGTLKLFSHGERADADGALFEKHVLFPLSLWFHRQTVENLVTERLKNDFVWQLAACEDALTEDLREQGARLGYDLTQPCTCIRMDILPSDAAENAYSPAAAARAGKVGEILHDTAAPFALRVLFASRGTDCVCYVTSFGKTPQKRIETFLSAAERTLSAEIEDGKFYIGVSETSSEPPDYGRLFHNASLALQYCRHAKKTRYFFTYQDTHMARALSVLSENAEVRAEAERVFQELSAQQSMDLTGTLAAYFESDRNISHTARRLGLHRQSLLYRLEKIEERTGMQLSNPRDLYLLETYTRMFADY